VFGGKRRQLLERIRTRGLTGEDEGSSLELLAGHV
jgi:hypothetical protein